MEVIFHKLVRGQSQWPLLLAVLQSEVEAVMQRIVLRNIKPSAPIFPEKSTNHTLTTMLKQKSNHASTVFV